MITFLAMLVCYKFEYQNFHYQSAYNSDMILTIFVPSQIWTESKSFFLNSGNPVSTIIDFENDFGSLLKSDLCIMYYRVQKFDSKAM